VLLGPELTDDILRFQRSMRLPLISLAQAGRGGYYWAVDLKVTQKYHVCQRAEPLVARDGLDCTMEAYLMAGEPPVKRAEGNGFNGKRVHYKLARNDDIDHWFFKIHGLEMN
jgi:hypothetical protein